MLERRSVLPFSSSGRPSQRRRARLLATGAAGALTLGLVGVAAPAPAADVRANWGYLEFHAEAGEVNDVLVEQVGDQMRITDSGVDSLTGPPGCTSTGNALTCPLSSYGSLELDLGDGADVAEVVEAPQFQVRVAGGAGADVLTGTGRSVFLDGGEGDDTVALDSGIDAELWWWGGSDYGAYGGAGDDTLTGGSHSEMLAGGAGDDVLRGGGGDDVLFAHDPYVWSGSTDSDRLDGGAGDDHLLPAGGSDNGFKGGDGHDLLQYGNSPQGVEVSLDDVANDGSAGQRDNAHSDIEVLNGSGYDDVLVGTSGRDEIAGNGGDDRLDGGAGRDRLDGGAGDDVVRGGDGDDRLVTPSGADDLGGGEGSDSLDLVRSGDVTVRPNGLADDGLPGEGLNVRGDVEEITTGDGDDVLIGSAADNEFVTGGGDDVVQGRGGNDGLDGGRGRDRVHGGRGTDTLVGGAGVDTVDSADGRADAVSCGGSTDTLTRDRRDQVSPDCELAG